ncbi:hypothetical protein GV64_06070 [Endozoicomonas elysicola]|uniref:Uncharacterized protein n=1 Tax=Endozoicomonas elysicola TaxID=305900 RepID=A0A081K874_9GAMM|nr:hypothetical protein GV64_06070 [Endozoicomonas elysicola]
MHERLAQPVVILRQASLTKQMAFFWATRRAYQGAPMTLLQHLKGNQPSCNAAPSLRGALIR